MYPYFLRGESRSQPIIIFQPMIRAHPSGDSAKHSVHVLPAKRPGQKQSVHVTRVIFGAPDAYVVSLGPSVQATVRSVCALQFANASLHRSTHVQEPSHFQSPCEELRISFYQQLTGSASW